MRTAPHHLEQTIQGLAGRQLDALGGALESDLTPPLVLRGMLGVFRFLERISSWRLGRHLERSIDLMNNQAIWFTGAAEQIVQKLDAQQLSEVAEQLALQVQQIEAMKSRILRMRKSYLDIISRVKRPHILELASMGAASAADLFEALEAYRWSLMEAQASCSKISSGYAANTPEELDAIFDRIAAEG